MKNAVTVVDFGTSKIVAMIADVSDRERLNILGLGSAEYDGYFDSKWNNDAQVAQAIQKAMDMAVESTGGRIKGLNPHKGVVFGIPAEFTFIKSFEVSRPLAIANAVVTREELDKLFSDAMKQAQDDMDKEPEINRPLLIGSGPAWFIVDGKRTMEPLNKSTDSISAKIVFIYAKPEFFASVTEKFKSLGYDNLGVLANGMGVLPLFLTQDELSRLSFFADIGYLNTEVTAFQGEMPVFTKVLPVGGAHIAMDLAYGLKINMEDAEKLKRRYAFGEGGRKVEVRDTDALDGKYTHEELSKYIDPRVDEICGMIEKTIEESGIKYPSHEALYITGGGIIRNFGAKEYMRNKLGRTVKELNKNFARYGESNYTSALGLLYLSLSSVNAGRKNNPVVNFFRELFRG